VDQFAKSTVLPYDQPFDYQLAMDRLRDYRAPRDKLGHLCRSGAVIRVRKGLYVPGWRLGEEPPVEPLVLAGLIYGPSYVSLETALARHGLIPERVEEITCITSKRAKDFRTPVGRFRYEPVSERVFGCGIRLEQARGGAFFMAEPEKALCDRVAMISGLKAAREVAAVLEDDLRVDVDAVMSTFRRPLVQEIAELYRRKSVAAFHRWLSRQN
jgi:predicted transcriptional regulator of viral defense system